jgi:hypothetical protein
MSKNGENKPARRTRHTNGGQVADRKWFAVIVIIFWCLLLADPARGTAWLEKQKLLASDGAAGDWFGRSVSISGDFAIVGAYRGSDSGSAYIFKREGAAWLLKQKLLASDGAAGDLFGYSVSISGDYAIIGASADDDRGSDSGSAYIFKRTLKYIPPGGFVWVWEEQAKLLASDGAANDLFGYSVSISGDYVIVGAPYDNDKGFDSGSAYIFKRDGTIWTQQQNLTASDGAALDYFGCSVSISGDYTIVGAHQDDDKGTDSGSAYIFKRDGESWVQQPKLLAVDGAAEDYFGRSVSISGDYAIVGAYGNDDRGSESGSAYIVKRVGIAWLLQPRLLTADGDDGNYFGHSVSISGDYAIVGAYGDDDRGSDSGSAYIFKRDGLEWLQQPKLLAADGTADDFFGYSVSISSDYAIVGAFADDDKGDASGSAYVFMKCPAADLSGDCFVDFEDFAIMADQWLQGD